VIPKELSSLVVIFPGGRAAAGAREKEKYCGISPVAALLAAVKTEAETIIEKTVAQRSYLQPHGDKCYFILRMVPKR